MTVQTPRRSYTRQIVGLVVLVLLSLGTGVLIARLTPVGTRWLALSIATAFLGLAIGITNVMTRPR